MFRPSLRCGSVPGPCTAIWSAGARPTAATTYSTARRRFTWNSPRDPVWPVRKSAIPAIDVVATSGFLERASSPQLPSELCAATSHASGLSRSGSTRPDCAGPRGGCSCLTASVPDAAMRGTKRSAAPNKGGSRMGSLFWAEWARSHQRAKPGRDLPRGERLALAGDSRVLSVDGVGQPGAASSCFAPRGPGGPGARGGRATRSAEARDQADGGEAPEGGRRERGRLAADPDSPVLSRCDPPGRQHLQDVPYRVTAGMEPDPQTADDEAEGEEDDQDLPATLPPTQESRATCEQEERRVAERKPGMPGLPEHFAMLEPHLGQEERRAPQDGRDDPFVQAQRTPPGDRPNVHRFLRSRLEPTRRSVRPSPRVRSRRRRRSGTRRCPPCLARCAPAPSCPARRRCAAPDRER